MTGTYKVPYVPLESNIPITLQSNVQTYSSSSYTRCYIRNGIVMLCLSLTTKEAIGNGWKQIASILAVYGAAVDVYFMMYVGVSSLKYGYASTSTIFINGPIDNNTMIRGSAMWVQGH